LKYTIAYGRQLVDKGKLKITEQKCPVDGGEITVRIFEPDAEKFGDGKKSVYVNFHGGGWVFGGLVTDFDFCKRVSHEIGAVCFDIDYRLAPEFKYPTAINDCWEAFNWIRDHKATEFNLDLNKVAVGGCSAGGHLSAVIAHECRDAGIPLAFQLLSVPVCDMHVFTSTGKLRPDQPYESYRECEFTQPLPAARMGYFHNLFLGNPRPQSLDADWRVSPILAPNFKGLAPALVITAELDPLRDEGEAYAQKLIDGGCKVQTHRLLGAPHLVMQLDDILDCGKEYNKVVIGALAGALTSVA